MGPHPPADWFEFWVRFFCGAIVGFGLGFYSLGPSSITWWGLSLCAVISGALAGWFGDRFWHALARWLGW